MGVGMLLVADARSVTDILYTHHLQVTAQHLTRRRQLIQETENSNTPLTADQAHHLLRSTRHTEFKFSDISRLNVQHYLDLLNLYFSLPGVEFHAIIIDRFQEASDLAGFKNYWDAYTSCARELLRRRLKQDVFALPDYQGTPTKPPTVRIEDALESVPLVRGCLRITSEMSVFVQVTDVLLGCLYADWKSHFGGFQPGSKRARAKLRVAKALRRHLQIPAGKPIVSNDHTYMSRRQPSPFSVYVWKPRKPRRPRG